VILRGAPELVRCDNIPALDRARSAGLLSARSHRHRVHRSGRAVAQPLRRIDSRAVRDELLDVELFSCWPKHRS
jgi:hypothetical protein